MPPLFAAMPKTTESDTEASTEQTATRQRPMGESLDARIRAVRRAFYRQFDDIPGGVEYFVLDVYEDVLIAERVICNSDGCQSDGMWQVSYMWNDGDVAFSAPDEWTEVEPAYVEASRTAVIDIERDKIERWAEAEERYTVLPPLQLDGLITKDSAKEVAEALEEYIAGAGGEDDTIQVDRVHAVSGPFIRMATEDPMAVQCRRDQRPYYRDFGPWDGPSPTVTRAESQDRVTVTINSTDEDRHGTIILPRGGRIDGYNESNPIVLINHDHDRPAGTSTVSVVGRDGASARLQADMQDDEWDHDDEEVMRWFRKVTRENPIVRSASIGALFHEVVPGREYDGIEDLLGREVNNRDRLPHIVTDWTLVEWSWVSVPSNPAATMALAEAERIARAAEARFRSGLRSLEHELHTTKSQVSVPGSLEPDAPSREGKPSHEDRSVSTDEEETGPSGEPTRASTREGDGAPRRLSKSEALTIVTKAMEDEIDRITGRK